MVTIGGIGCCLIDIIYKNIDFSDSKNASLFSNDSSKKGLIPGSLVFKNDLEKYTGCTIHQILHEVLKRDVPDIENLGGPGIIALLHASQLLVNDKKASLSYEGVIGKDEYGEKITSLLENSSLKHVLMNEKEGETPTTIVLSDPYYHDGAGERSFIHTHGVASLYSHTEVSDALLSKDIVFFGGTALIPRIHDNLSYLIAKAKMNNSFICVTTVYDFSAEQHAPLDPWPLVDNVGYQSIDLLIMDAQEAKRISNCNTIESAIIFFKEKGVGATIITHGQYPVVAYASSPMYKRQNIAKFPISDRICKELAAQKCPQGDTTGCGDNFAGGVLASVASQATLHGFSKIDIVQAISWGVCSGGYTCLHTGGMFVERFKGEKLSLLIPYVRDYLKQINYEEPLTFDSLSKGETYIE